MDVVTWSATAAAVAACLALPVIRRGPVRAVFIVAVSVACALWHVRLRPVVRSPIEHVAWSCAVLSAVWALAVVAVGSRAGRRGARDEGAARILPLARLAAILFGAVSGVILAVLLAMRCALTVAELINDGPGISGFDQSFTTDGLWSLACLWVACAVSLVTTRDVRLATGTFVVGSMGLTWACLLGPVFVATESHGYARSPVLLLLIVLQSAWLFLAAYLADRVDRRNGPQRIGVHFAVTRSALRPIPVEPPQRTGLRLCCDIVAVVIALAICYHVVVPQRTYFGGLSISSAGCLVAAALAANACLRWLRRSWSGLTAEVGLGHLSLVACSGATLVAAGCGLPLEEQYPATFAAMMVGFCLAAGACACLALRGYRLRATDGGDATLVARLAPYARRFAFVDAALAFLVGVVMMVWPRLPTIATMDDSLGRVTSGLGANLLLLLVVLWCGRRLRQPAFDVLTVLTMLLIGGFLLVRILPFSSHIG